MADSSHPVITPVYQFYADNPWRWNYSSDPDQGTSQRWTRDGIEFFAFGQNQLGVVPVYLSYTDTDWRPHFSLNENDRPGPGWKPGGIWFYAFANQTPNTMAVYEYHTSDKRYRYSTNGGIREPGWTLGGVRFYTFGATPG